MSSERDNHIILGDDGEFELPIYIDPITSFFKENPQELINIQIKADKYLDAKKKVWLEQNLILLKDFLILLAGVPSLTILSDEIVDTVGALNLISVLCSWAVLCLALRIHLERRNTHGNTLRIANNKLIHAHLDLQRSFDRLELRRKDAASAKQFEKLLLHQDTRTFRPTHSKKKRKLQ